MNVRRYLAALVVRCRDVFRYDLRTEIAQDSIVVLLGHLMRIVLGLASSVLLARGLGPAGLSVFAVVGAALAISTTVADFGLRNSAIRQIAGELADNVEAARRTAGTYARLKLLGGLVVASVLVVFARPVSALLSLPPNQGQPLIWLAAFGLLAATLSGISATLLQALRRFRALVGSQMLNTALTVALFGGLFLMQRLTVSTALVVGAVTALGAAGLGYILVPSEWRAALFRAGTLRNPESRRLLGFGTWLWISAILSILSAQLDLLLLNQWLAASTVGLYALAVNLAQKADIIHQTLHTVLLPAVSALSTREAYVDYVRRSLVRSFMLSVLVVVALLLARPFIVVVYGSTYAGSVDVFRLLMLVTLFELLVGPLLLLAFPMNMPRVIAASDAVRVGTLFAVGTLLIPAWGMYGAVFAKLAASLSGALVTGIAITRRLRERARPSLHSEPAQDTDVSPTPLPPDPT